MTSIDILGAQASVRTYDVLTTGMVGAMVEFRFDKSWDNLVRTAVFRQGAVTKDVVNIGTTAKIPPEVLMIPGLSVKIGVLGTNSDGTVVIPTVWAETRPVKDGTDPSGDESADPTLPVWEQILATIGDMHSLSTEAKGNLVASINELVQLCEDGTVDAEYIQQEVEKYLKENPVTETDPTVPDWAKQPTKPKYTAQEVGAVATVNGQTPDENGNVEIEIPEAGGAVTDEQIAEAVNDALAQAKASGEFDGKDGQDGSPGKDGSNGVSATHSWNGTTLTVTSASGTSSANLKGEKGDKGDSVKGDKGDTGAAGTSVTVKSVSESTADGGSNVVTFSDGKTVTIKNGSKGSTGSNGSNGKDGTSVTHSWSGTTLTVTSASGTSSANLKGEKGETGAQGAKGDKGDKGDTGAAGKDYSFDPTVYGLPVLELTGDTTGMTKETEVTLSYECNDKDGTAKTGSCTMKWQGSSSLAWDKKNYTIKFDNAFEVVDGWGSQKKYCLKANWIDHSHSRNVVSAKLWGLIRKNRSNLNSKLKNLPNAGAIDGFPVIIMLNGEFHGLYSWNIPKDAWMFGMGSGTKEAIVGADNQADDTAFKAETLLDADGWELEYNSSSFSADAVKTSLNNLIKACINSWGGDLDTEVAKYLDWESAIDYYIFAVILQGGDMITKNTILATFDGVKWYFSAYDMDTTYGLEFDGSKLNRAVTASHTTFETIAETHRVFELIKRFKTNELKARYTALRADALSESRICNYFENYAWDISSPILVEEVKKWPSVRGSSVNGIDQICRWVRQRLEATDKWINALPAQETPVEPEEPVEMVNQVPISTDTDGSIYNGTGYKDNVRLSSSGGVSGSAQTGSVVTGFIPFKNTDVIRIKGAEWLDATTKYTGHYYLNFYDSSKAFVTNGNMSSQAYATSFANQMSVVYDEATGITTFQIIDPTGNNGNLRLAAQKAAYFRINAYGKGADLIITINQEIT